MLSKESIATIMRAGGSMRIGNLSKEALVELASIARQANVRLEIVGSLSAESWVEVARAGGANVLIDISK
jgi:hypothetical protein